jgi:hypothetical protein
MQIKNLHRLHVTTFIYNFFEVEQPHNPESAVFERTDAILCGPFLGMHGAVMARKIARRTNFYIQRNQSLVMDGFPKRKETFLAFCRVDSFNIFDRTQVVFHIFPRLQCLEFLFDSVEKNLCIRVYVVRQAVGELAAKSADRVLLSQAVQVIDAMTE